MDVLERLKTRTGEQDETLLNELLESAKAAILARRFPYGDGSEELEPRYLDLQVRIACAMYDKLGANYEIGHAEGGVSRSWKSEGIPESLLSEITPMCGRLQWRK